MTRWIVLGGVVVALVGLLVLQQRRLDRLEDAVKQASATQAAAVPAEAGAPAPVFAVGGGEGSAAGRAPRVKFVPVPVPVAAGAASTGGSAAPGAPAAAAVAGVAAPINPALLARTPLAERMAQTPAQPIMAETSAPVREFVQQNNIDQATWTALVKANKDWVDTLVKVKQSGITSAPGPIDQLARRHDSEVSTILGDQGVVDSYNKMQEKVTAPKVSVQWGGKTYGATRIE